MKTNIYIYNYRYNERDNNEKYLLESNKEDTVMVKTMVGGGRATGEKRNAY